MEYSIQALGRMTGVSGRTLRYYDEIGLLKPLRTNSAGYRIYGPKEVKRLQSILFYRDFGLELKTIGALLHLPEVERQAVLFAHLSSLHAERKRLDQLIAELETWLEGEQDMSKFETKKKKRMEEQEARYGAEARERYGAEAVERSRAKMEEMPETLFEAMCRIADEINGRLERAVQAGLAPDSEEGQAIAALHRQWLDFSWPTYSPEAHVGLAEMYAEDERFTAYYDGKVPGCAAFLRDAIRAYCGSH